VAENLHAIEDARARARTRDQIFMTFSEGILSSLSFHSFSAHHPHRNPSEKLPRDGWRRGGEGKEDKGRGAARLIAASARHLTSNRGE